MNLNLKSNNDFIEKLGKVVEDNLSDEKFGVRELAKEVRLSRTQLHRRLKSINNQSVSQFIRHIRLNKAKELLQEGYGTVSEIAYKVGFGSPSYFIKCFHGYFGYSPGVLLKLPFGSNEKDESISEFEEEISFSIGKSNKKSLSKFLMLISLISVLAVILIVIYKNYYSASKAEIKEKSIVVLPLRNLSEKKETQYMADGIMEDILNRLSHINELKVKSRISSEQYRESEKSIPEIAKEMNASYVLEGSIMRNLDKVRIYVQLIDAETDNHIWSDEYNEDLTDIFVFTSNVSKHIAEELQIVLTKIEIDKLEKNYTINKEAYNFYLLGRYFWHRRTKDDLIKSVKYFNRAITQDPNYSLAYAGLSDAYNSLAWYKWYPREESIIKCKEYADKAINLDYNLAEAHAALGDCASDFLWDWDLAENEFQLAITLNPNFALAYKYYADYLDIRGKNQEARALINIAIELNPQSLPIYQSSADCYYNTGDFERALIDLEKVLELKNGDAWTYFLMFKIYFHERNDEQALIALKHFLNLTDENVNDFELQEIYNKKGMEGIVKWLIQYSNISNNYMNDYYFANLYALLNDKKSAIEYLEKSYDSEDKIELPLINNSFDFKTFHGEPRFNSLLKKMNLLN